MSLVERVQQRGDNSRRQVYAATRLDGAAGNGLVIGELRGLFGVADGLLMDAQMGEGQGDVIALANAQHPCPQVIILGGAKGWVVGEGVGIQC